MINGVAGVKKGWPKNSRRPGRNNSYRLPKRLNIQLMSNSSLDPEIAERISLIRYPMIFLIVVSHSPNLSSFADDPNLSTFITSLVSDTFIRLAIPMLSCISGFLIFYKAMEQNFPLLLRKRFNALVSPLIVWNVPIVLALYAVQSQGLIDYEFAPRKTMYPADLMTWLNGIFSITDFPINFPMHFLRDLFIITLFVPLMGIALRKFPFIGLIILLAIFVPDFDGQLIRTNTIIVTFYVGGMAAKMGWDLKYLDRYTVPLFFLMFSMCVFIVVYDLGRPVWLPLLAPFIVWPIASVLVGSRFGTWLRSLSRASIFLFMFHGLAVLTTWAVFPNLRDETNNVFIWLFVPLLIAMISQVVYLSVDRLSPALLTLLIGGRKPTGNA